MIIAPKRWKQFLVGWSKESEAGEKFEGDEVEKIGLHFLDYKYKALSFFSGIFKQVCLSRAI